MIRIYIRGSIVDAEPPLDIFCDRDGGSGGGGGQRVLIKPPHRFFFGGSSQNRSQHKMHSLCTWPMMAF